MKASKKPRAILLAATPKKLSEIEVVSEVRLQMIAAVERRSLRDILSASTPENNTVIEKKIVKTAPDNIPNFVYVKPGISSLISYLDGSSSPVYSKSYVEPIMNLYH